MKYRKNFYKDTKAKEAAIDRMKDGIGVEEKMMTDYELVIKAKEMIEELRCDVYDADGMFLQIMSMTGEEKFALAIVASCGQFYNGQFMLPATKDALEYMSWAREQVVQDGEVDLPIEDEWEWDHYGEITTEHNCIHHTYC